MIPAFSSALQTQQEAMRWEGWRHLLPPFKISAPQWGEKMVQNQIREAVSAGWRVFVQAKGFYQRQTLTGIPVWDCPSNSCVPQEALHKKQLKNAQRHFICRLSTHGEHLELTARFFYLKPPARALKETGTMEESSSPLVGRLVPMASSKPARAHAPDDPMQRG